MNTFDKLSLEIVEHGIYYYWETKVGCFNAFFYYTSILTGRYISLKAVNLYLDFKTVRGMHFLKKSHLNTKIPRQLNMKHIAGHLNLYVFGITFSLCIFLFEVIYFNFYENRLSM